MPSTVLSLLLYHWKLAISASELFSLSLLSCLKDITWDLQTSSEDADQDSRLQLSNGDPSTGRNRCFPFSWQNCNSSFRISMCLCMFLLRCLCFCWLCWLSSSSHCCNFFYFWSWRIIKILQAEVRSLPPDDKLDQASYHPNNNHQERIGWTVKIRLATTPEPFCFVDGVLFLIPLSWFS